MSFPFLFGVEYYDSDSSGDPTFNITTSTGEGANVYGRFVGPSSFATNFSSSYAGKTMTYQCSNPIGYLSNNFRLWRGAIVMQVQIVSTKFHSMRLAVTWTPTTSMANIPTPATSVLSMRTIIDVREGTHFKLILPYLVNTMYLPRASYSGEVNILLENQLVCPETVANNVDVIVTYCGHTDFEFAAPSYTSNVSPVVFCAQSGDVECDFGIAQCSLVDETIGGEPLPVPSLTPAQYCIGERIQSVKQLLLKATQFSSLNASAPVWNNTTSIAFDPYFIGALGMNTGTGGVTTGSIGGDAFGLIVPMYAMIRGGVNFQLLSNGNFSFTGTTTYYATNDIGLLKANAVTTSYYSTNVFPGSSSVSSMSLTGAMGLTTTAPFAGLTASDGSSGILPVRVPFICPTVASYSMRFYDGVSTAVNSEATSNLSNPVFTNYAFKLSTNSIFCRSVADDFQCCYFICCPPRASNYA